jgi:glycine cleavage system aminomethyltransferase T
VRELTWRNDERLLIASPEQESRLTEWLRHQPRNAALVAAPTADQTTALAMLELQGPAREGMLAELISTSGLEMHTFNDGVTDSTLILVPSVSAASLWQHLLRVGNRFGARLGGHFAQEALRIRRGVPGFGFEATPARQAAEIGLGGFGANPTLAAPRTHARRTLVAFESPMPYQEFGSREVVLHRGTVVGELTSRVRLPGWPMTLALGLLDPRRWQGGASDAELQTVAGGKRWPLTMRDTAWTTHIAARTGAR